MKSVEQFEKKSMCVFFLLREKKLFSILGKNINNNLNKSSFFSNITSFFSSFLFYIILLK